MINDKKKRTLSIPSILLIRCEPKFVNFSTFCKQNIYRVVFEIFRKNPSIIGAGGPVYRVALKQYSSKSSRISPKILQICYIAKNVL